ncbi:hypothetical protein PVAND_006105 [Polypedilum vanderplanki]|uniref:Arrestin-like N-terminal domain-containing protein n=1 Tax=Polypedilum vanderplanki TaxID=319348 RepID=A0A9J6C243_POLVA|nr:hypothetical protein PVAND_006105 [Polypedilum vanderplanki]
MTKISITLFPSSERRLLIFNPGNLLKGFLEISLDNIKKFRSCFVQIYGSARVSWIETQNSEKNRFEDKEIYLDSKTFLFESRELAAGTHRFNFSCQLPEMLPESMKELYGEIEYFVKAVLESP